MSKQCADFLFLFLWGLSGPIIVCFYFYLLHALSKHTDVHAPEHIRGKQSTLGDISFTGNTQNGNTDNPGD